MGIAIPQVVTEDRAASALSVDGSLRFNGSNQYLRRAFGTAGHQSIFTWSCWVKRNELDTWQRIFTCEPGSNLVGGLSFRDPDSKIRLQQQGFSVNNHLLTTPTYRDISAWYHIVMRVDTFHATAGDRFRIYVNGVKQDYGWDVGSNPAQGSQLYYNTTNNYHEIGHSTQYNAYQKGQMTQCYWLDGQSLGPEHFGFTDPLTNTWRPKKYVKGAFEELDKFNTYTWGEIQNQLDYQGIKFPSNAGGTVAWKATGSSNTGLNLYTSTDNSTWTRRVSNITVDSTNGFVYESSYQYVILVNGSDAVWSNQLQMYSDVNGAKIHYSNADYPGNGNPTMSWSGPAYTDGTIGSYNSFYIPLDGTAPIGEDQSGNGNDFTPVFFGSSTVPDQANGAKPILNTLGGTARSGVFGSEAGARYITTSASNSGGKYVFEGHGTQPKFSFIRGATYTFDWSASSGHPLRFATAADAAGSTEYTDGTNVSGNVTKITVPHNAPDTLYYYCNVHNGMGNSISVTTDESKADPYAWKCVLAQPLTSNEEDVSNQINCTSTEKAITATGAASSPKFYNLYGSSTYLDGNTKIQTPDNNDFDFGTEDFTVEIWARANSTSGDQYIVSWENPASGTRPDANHSGINIYNGNWRIGGFNNYLVNNNVGLQSETWMHIAMSRVSGTLRVFVNGTLIGSKNTTSVLFNCSSNFTLGAYAGSSNPHKFVGYLQDFRVYKGVGKYVDNFTPASDDPDILPDSPSGVSNKSRLKKITNGSVAFNRSPSAYLTLPDHADLAPGNGDFTVETFLYARAFADYPVIWDSRESGGADTNGFFFGMMNTGKIYLFDNSGTRIEYEFLSLRRWHHVALVRKSNDFKLYVDGVQRGSTYTRNHNFTNRLKRIGDTANSEVNTWEFDGFFSNYRFTKGQALYDGNFSVPTQPLTATSQGATSSNVKLLCCQSNSSVTAATIIPTGSIGTSGSPRATTFNPFTSSIDAIRGQESNYCTWNPLTMSRGNLHDGNLLFYGNGTNTPRINGTISKTSGKWYYEATVLNDGPGTGSGDVHNSIGWGLDSVSTIETAPNTSAMNHSFYFMDSGYYKNFAGSNTNTSTGKWLTGDVIGIAADLDNNVLTFFKNNYQVLSATIGTTAGTPLCPAHQSNTGNYGRSVANFGQKPFKYLPPEGFQPLSASSVRPDNVIVRPDQFFAVTKYDGNTDSSQDINVGFAPDLVWQKIYNQAGDNALTDTVRGVNAGYLQSEDADKEKGNANDGISAFLSNGFRAYNSFNNNGLNWVSWCWKAGGSGSDPFYIDDVGYASAAAAGMNGGSITPIGASVGKKQGFSIITYTSNLTQGATISHGLTQKPDFAIFKNRDSTLGADEVDWGVYHSGVGATKCLELNQQLVAQTMQGPFNNVEPTSSLFTFGGAGSGTSGSHSYLTNGPSGDKFIAYIWHNVPGLQKFGVYDGTGSGGTTPFIELGFRPALVWLKSFEGSTSNWVILDDKRPGYNSELQTLCANLNNGHNASGGTSNDILSNGFKIRGSSDRNASNTKYIYCAWAASPFSNLYGAQSNAA